MSKDRELDGAIKNLETLVRMESELGVTEVTIAEENLKDVIEQALASRYKDGLRRARSIINEHSDVIKNLITKEIDSHE